MKVEPQQLKAFLLDAGLLTQVQFDEAQKKAEKTKQKIGDVLVSEGLIGQEELIKLEAYILGIPFVNLGKEVVLPEVLKIIPEPIARSHNIVAFRKKGVDLEVAMLDPEDLRTIEFIKKTTNLRILPRLTDPESIKNVLRQYQKTLEVEFGEIIKKEIGVIKPIKEELAEEKIELQKIAEELPIIRIVETLLKHAILQRASDIHIEPTEKEVIVRYRIDGILRDAMTLPKISASGIVARIKVLSNLKLDEHRLPQDGRFKIETEDYRYSIRVSVLPVFNGEKIVMRLLPETAKAFTLEQLGLRNEALERVQDNLRKPVGMILVTGPTGCGKTTTLYSMMEILNDPGVNISTIEDPVEYRMPRINQTQVNPKIGLTFANGLRSLVRQDPDIIMVGEIRDEETAFLATHAALTGHLVLSTLHTNNAIGTIPRLIDLGVKPYLIPPTVNISLAQRLVRKLCSECKKKIKPAAKIRDLILAELDAIPSSAKGDLKIPKDLTIFEPVGCKKCRFEGYSGRIAVFEVLAMTDSLAELILKEPSEVKILEEAKNQGMITMKQDGILKVLEGVTSIEEVLRVAEEK